MESSGRLIILLVAGVIVAFAAIAIRNYMGDQPAAPEPTAAAKRVIIAKHDITLGTLVQLGSDIDWAEAPADADTKPDLLREGNVTLEEFSGAVARRPIRTGEMLTVTSLAKTSEGGFMSAVLEPGMRAISISVNATSGNAGFISPGDRIDLIVTYQVKQSSSGSAIVSETFLSNVRVLAVDQQLDNPENKAILAKTVTVEVDPQQAEQVAVAGELGRISVALRATAQDSKPAAGPAAANDNEKAAEVVLTPETPERAITDLYGNPAPDANAFTERKPLSPRIRVIRGDQSESVEF